jgi:deazaflavin-dependent oxidoreductase (nitroreductase family)
MKSCYPDVRADEQMITDILVFPTPETRFYKILNNAEYRRSFLANLKTYNPLIVTLYRSGLLPLLGYSRTILLLMTTGRKSGKPRVTPIGYYRIGGTIHLFSAWGKRAGWYKNMVANPGNIQIQIGWRKWPVTVQILTDPKEILRTIYQFVEESPYQAQTLFGWRPDHDDNCDVDFSVILKKVLTIRFVDHLTGNPPIRHSSQKEKDCNRSTLPVE